MKIKFTGKYKSLSNDFESEELTDFSILTGRNGSGKSQLIYCIDKCFVQQKDTSKGFNLEFEPILFKVQISDLKYVGMGSASIGSIKSRYEQHFNKLSSLKPIQKDLYSILLEKNVHLKKITNLNIKDFATELNIPKLRELFIGVLEENNFRGFQSLTDEIILAKFKNIVANDFPFFEVLEIVTKFTGKALREIILSDFNKSPIPEKYLDQADLFQSRIEMIFFSYLKRRHDNDYLTFRNKQYNELNNVITEKEFEMSYPAPWDVINKILSDNNIGLEVCKYETRNYSEEITVQAKFKKTNVSETLPSCLNMV